MKFNKSFSLLPFFSKVCSTKFSLFHSRATLLASTLSLSEGTPRT